MSNIAQTQSDPLVKNKNGKIRVGNPKYSRPFNLFLLLFSALSIALLAFMPFNWLQILQRLGNLGDSISHLLTIDLSEIDLVLPYFFETMCVTLLATVYSAVLGLGLAVFMAKNITPHKSLPPLLTAVFTFIRAVPSFVWVLLLLVCLGFGTAPAIFGICIHSSSFFARSISHAFEEVEQGTLDALAATGANGGFLLPTPLRRRAKSPA